ncbi:hypothetical protein V7S43_001663 [Phytophthora oleae]|uniref:Uncharacterized protein n=1 Tax=Phytophthora oleae TaxID=2107226 RepID=A0ABD3G4C2_9STRA
MVGGLKNSRASQELGADDVAACSLRRLNRNEPRLCQRTLPARTRVAQRLAKTLSAPSVHASYVEATEEQRVVSDALHMLNTVVRPPMGEATQWSIVRDHKRQLLYIRSTANQLLRRVSLDMFD